MTVNDNLLKPVAMLLLGSCIGSAGSYMYLPDAKDSESNGAIPIEASLLEESVTTEIKNINQHSVADSTQQISGTDDAVATQLQNDQFNFTAIGFADYSSVIDQLQLLENFSKSDLHGIAEELANSEIALETQESLYSTSFMGMFFLRWAELDLDAALEFLLNHPVMQDASIVSKIMRKHLDFIAIDDQAQALQWAGSISDENARNLALQAAGLQWFENSVEDLNFYLLLNPADYADPNNQSNIVLTAVLDSLIKRDPVLALEWLEQLGDVATAALKPKVIEGWLKSRPEGVVDWLTGLPTEELQAELPELMPHLALSQPQASIELFPYLDESNQAMLVTIVAEGLFLIDQGMAQQWVSTLTNSDLQHSATTSLVEMSAIKNIQDNPEQALKDIENLDGQSRTDNLFSVVSKMALSHPTVVENWLTYAELSDHERIMLQSFLQETSR